MNLFEIITPIDTAILDFIQSTIRCGFLDGIMAFFSYIGNGGTIWIAASIIMLFFRKTRVMGVTALCAMALGHLVGEVWLKNLLCRPRPFVVQPDVVLNINPPKGYSCPSGHSCSSFAAATAMFAYNKRFGIPALCIAFLVAFSRLYNYVHYPSDVLLGIALGIACALVIFVIFRKTNPDRILKLRKA